MGYGPSHVISPHPALVHANPLFPKNVLSQGISDNPNLKEGMLPANSHIPQLVNRLHKLAEIYDGLSKQQKLKLQNISHEKFFLVVFALNDIPGALPCGDKLRLFLKLRIHGTPDYAFPLKITDRAIPVPNTV